jgi:hypothetical protein
MTRGRPIPAPKIVVVHSDQPRFASRDEAWTTVGPIWARILAQTILRDLESQPKKANSSVLVVGKEGPEETNDEQG